MAYIKATKEDRELASRLREIREQLFGSRGGTKMAEFLNVPQPTYYAYENAEVRLPHRIMTVLARKKNINLTWLITGQGSKFLSAPSRATRVENEEVISKVNGVNIPVLESVGAGDPQEIKEIEPIDHIIIDNYFVTLGMVALRVRGNSMEADIPDGSIVGVDVRKRSSKDLQTRMVCVLWVRHEGLIIRRFYKDGKDLSFIPDNPIGGNRPYIYTYLKKERRYNEEPIINGCVEWVLNKLYR